LSLPPPLRAAKMFLLRQMLKNEIGRKEGERSCTNIFYIVPGEVAELANFYFLR